MTTHIVERALLILLSVLVIAHTVPARGNHSPEPVSKPMAALSRSNPIDEDTPNRRGLVAIAKRSSIAFGSGVFIGRDRVLTASHNTYPHPGLMHRYRPEQLEVWFDYDVPVPEGNRLTSSFPVIAYDYRSLTSDFCVLLLGPNTRGELPAATRIVSMTDAQGSLDGEVYVLHHPKGRPAEIAYGGAIAFPYLVDGVGWARILGRAMAESPRAIHEIAASYVLGADGLFRNHSKRWASLPTLGIDSDTSKGSSGGPVFDARTHALLGILYAGTDRTETSWERHEAIVPLAVIRQELAHSAHVPPLRKSTKGPRANGR